VILFGSLLHHLTVKFKQNEIARKLVLSTMLNIRADEYFRIKFSKNSAKKKTASFYLSSNPNEEENKKKVLESKLSHDYYVFPINDFITVLMDCLQRETNSEVRILIFFLCVQKD
jgi:hypothetical protein